MPKVLQDITNGNGVSEAVFFDHHKVREDLVKQRNDIDAKIRVREKLMEDDGIDVQDYKDVLRRRKKPLAKQQKSYENSRLYMRFFKMPISAHMAVIPEMQDDIGLTEEQRQQKWEDEGFIAGREGKNRDVCPHEDPNSLGARFWMAGYEKGQKENAKGIKKKQAEPKQDAAEKKPAADAGSATPKHEPEVEEAKRRGRPAKGVTYWHNPTLKKVYEVTISDANPEGAVSITRPEYFKLKDTYEAAEKAEWDAAEKAKAESEATGEAGPGKTADDVGFDDDDEPPAPGAKSN